MYPEKNNPEIVKILKGGGGDYRSIPKFENIIRQKVGTPTFTFGDTKC